MANVTISHSEVKSICNELEKSPSKDNMKSSHIYHKSGGHTGAHGAGAVPGSGFKAPPSKKGAKKNSKDPYTA